MRALIQRVRESSVEVDGRVLAAIGPGMCILLGVRRGDGPEEARRLAEKCVNLRIFPDEEGKMNRSLLEVGGEALVISQFTLYGDASKGRRPSFIHAARPEEAQPLVDLFAHTLHRLGVRVQTGVFGAHMLVRISNDGPVTLLAP